MQNHEIPSEIWRLRNLIINNIERHMSNSNNQHYEYKSDFIYGARSIQHLCDKIKALAEQFEQDPER